MYKFQEIKEMDGERDRGGEHVLSASINNILILIIHTVMTSNSNHSKIEKLRLQKVCPFELYHRQVSMQVTNIGCLSIYNCAKIT